MLFLALVALVVAFFVVIIAGAVLSPERFLDQAQQILPFPHSLTIIAQVAVILGQLLAAVFMAQSVGSEYSQDTWKMILPRSGQRLVFLAAKMGIGLVGMLFALMTMHLVGIGLSLVGAAVLRLPPVPAVVSPTLVELLRGVLVLPLPMLLYASVALFVTVATRSAIGGALLTFFGLQTVALFAPLYGPVAIVMPYPHLPNIIEQWTFRDAEAINRVNQGFGYTVSPWLSVIVILAYCAASALAAGWLFQRRDMTADR